MMPVSHRRLGWLTAATIAGLAALGCIPKRIVWSPDGQRAVVMAKSQVYLTDGDGRLSEPWKAELDQAAWFHDSKRVAVLRKQRVATWEEIKPFLSEERQDELLKMADSLRETILAYQGDWNQWRPRLSGDVSDGELVALWLYVREHRNEGLREKLGDQWKDFSEMTPNVSLVQLCDVSDDGFKPGPVIVRSVEEIGAGFMRIAPRDQCLAYVANKHDDVGDLMVCEAREGAVPRRAAECVAAYPSWSVDGQMLVYARTSPPTPNGGNDVRLGSISRRQVCSYDGRLIEDFGTAEDLAGILFSPQTKVQPLPDGRILFSAAETYLPSTSKDMPTAVSLFAIDAERQPTLTRLITRSAERTLPADGLSSGLFEVSPDGTRVSVPDWDSGGLFVYTFATGEVKEVLPASKDSTDLPGVPSWRSDQELCITVPPGGKWGSEKRPEVVLWSLSKDDGRVISREWSDQVVADLAAK